MRAMIFAAGLGTRLKPLTNNRPKALVTVAGKPMLEHVILKLKAAGFDEIVINVHHFANQILAFLEANNNFGIKIHISDETDELLDTGGGLNKARAFLDLNRYDLKEIKPEPADPCQNKNRSECILLHNVDILSNCNLQELTDYHQHTHSAATLLVSKRHTSRYLLFDEGNLLRGWINKATNEVKPADLEYEAGKYKEYAYSGIQVITPLMFTYLTDKKWQGKFSIIDFYLAKCDTLKIQCYVKEDLQLMDIGKPETLAKAEEFLSGI